MKIFEILTLGAVLAQEDACQPGDIDLGNGLCAADSETAAAIQPTLDDLNNDDDDGADANATGLASTRRFQLGSVGGGSERSEQNMRTKKRTQRIALLAAKVGATRSGSRLKPREFLKRINNYGCHCWTKAGTEHIGYKGKPLDGIDRACRALKSCHACIEIDHSNCDPITTKYRARVQKNTMGITITCTNTLNHKKTNNGQCKHDLCECDKRFAEAVAESWDEWDQKNHNLDAQGLFDRACVTGGGSNGAQRLLNSDGPPNQCCGTTYPDMKPFNTASHQCTSDKLVMPVNNL